MRKAIPSIMAIENANKIIIDHARLLVRKAQVLLHIVVPLLFILLVVIM